MICNLQEIPEGHSTFSCTAVLNEEQAADASVTAPVDCQVACDRFGASLYLEITYVAQVQLLCSRCLAENHTAITGKFKTSLAGKTAADEDTEFVYEDGQLTVDISAALYDEIMLNQPIQPLCSPPCPEPVEVEEGSGERESDPRWDALRALKK